MASDCLVTRNLQVGNSRTTIALEPIFWTILEEISQNRRLTVTQLIQDIEDMRGKHNRASAIRVYVINYLMPIPNGNEMPEMMGRAMDWRTTSSPRRHISSVETPQ
jgi:predicted DNA-binding ribbon-helix-helix protein